MKYAWKSGSRCVAILGLAAALAACGGGNDDDRAPVAATPSGGTGDTTPSSVLVNLVREGFIVANPGDTWLYDRVTDDGETEAAAVTRTVVLGPDAKGNLGVRELDAQYIQDIAYRMTPSGLTRLDPLGAERDYPSIFKALPTFLEYPADGLAVGATRKVAKSGSLEHDQDGDGRDDDFDAVVTQTFKGFETVTVLGESVQAARIVNTSVIQVNLSAAREGDGGALKPYAITWKEDVWLVPDLGLVRAERSGEVQSGQVLTSLFPAHTLVLRSATVGGKSHATVTFGVDRDVVAVAASNRSSQAGPVESVRVSVVDPSGHPLFVKAMPGASPVIQFIEVGSQTDQGSRVDIHFSAPKGLVPDTYNGTIDVQVCYDSACRKPAGSVIKVHTTYVVTDDPADEPGIAALKVLERKAFAHNIVDAEFNQRNQTLVTVSTWPEFALYVYDLATHTEKKLPLEVEPLALAISPNGREAAIGHNGFVSWLQLDTVGQAEPVRKRWPVNEVIFDIALGDDGLMHASPISNAWNFGIYSVRVSDGSIQTVGGGYSGTKIRMSPDSKSFYTVDTRVSPDDISRYTITDGVVQYRGDSPYHGDYPVCQALWLSEDGNTAYTGCGNVFSLTPIDGRSNPLAFIGSFGLTPPGEEYNASVVALSPSAAMGEVALIEFERRMNQTSYLWECQGECYHHLHLFTLDRARKAEYSLSPVVVAGRAYMQKGVSLFHADGGQSLYLISQLPDVGDPASAFYLTKVGR